MSRGGGRHAPQRPGRDWNRRPEAAGSRRSLISKHTGGGETVRGRQRRVPPYERPEILPRPPCWNFRVDQRAPGNIAPVLHSPDEQVVANFFSCIHFFYKSSANARPAPI